MLLSQKALKTDSKAMLSSQPVYASTSPGRHIGWGLAITGAPGMSGGFLEIIVKMIWSERYARFNYDMRELSVIYLKRNDDDYKK